jgi:hypothetical protein
MSTSIHRSRQPQTRGARPSQQRRAQAIQSPLSHQATAEHRHIVNLLRRGAGVTQILRETGQPDDSPSDRLLRADRLRRILEALPASSDADAPRLAPRKLARTLAYLDRRLGLMQAEVEWTRHGRQQSSVTTDSYGVQVQVQNGLPCFTMIGVPDDVQHIIGEDLRKRLGTLWPSRRITVVTPRDWTPHDPALRALAHAIHVDHTY